MGSLLVLLLTMCPDARTCDTQVEQGRVLIRDLREEEALRLLEPVGDALELPPALRARADIYAGIAWMNLGLEPKARVRFRAALALDSGAALPGWASRRVRATFDAVARSASPRLTPVAGLPPGPGPAMSPPISTAASAARPASGKLPLFLELGALACAAVSVGALLHASSLHGAARREPQALAAQADDARARPYWYGGEAFGAGAVGLALGGWAAWRF